MIARRHRLAYLLFVVLAAGRFTAARADITYAGGNGSTLEKAVVIKGATEETRVQAENEWVTKRFRIAKGRTRTISHDDVTMVFAPFPAIIRGTLTFVDSEGDSKTVRFYDVIQITIAAGLKKTIFFDVDSSGK